LNQISELSPVAERRGWQKDQTRLALHNQGRHRAQAPWPARAEPTQIVLARQELAKGVGIAKVARLTGLGTGTVHKLKREMATAAGA
jgi:hypothetical protein